MKYTLDVLREERVARNLQNLGARATHAQPVLLRASRVLGQGIHATFDTRGSAIGKPWPALKDGRPATLVATGGLAQQVANMKRTTRTQAIAGIKGPEGYIARFHQAGTKRGLPARPIVGIPPATRAVLLRMVESYLVEGRQ